MHDEGEIAMAEDKILCDNSVITRDTPEYKELIATMRNTVQVADRFMKEVRPCLLQRAVFHGQAGDGPVPYQSPGIAELSG